MIKLPYRWLLPVLLMQQGAAIAAAAEPLFKVISSSPTIPADSYSTTCTISNSGRVDITRTTSLFSSGTTFKSTESKTVKLDAAVLRKVIDEAAKGSTTGSPLLGGGTHYYFAYQKQARSAAKEILLLDKKGGLSNDSPVVKPLSKFIDDLCGDTAQ